ncbi:MAG: endonuclease/exonuclease/phosphatase family protein [Anaerolineae bacterium]|nr:endonuclease/exonuclease/phosphatase family protein [Anaerolineae bacterium]
MSAITAPPERTPRFRWMILWRAFVNLGMAAAGLYGLTVTAFLLLHVLVGERWTLVAWFNSFVHLLVVPAVALFPLGLLLRRKSVVILLPPLLAFVLIYIPAIVPPTVQAAPEESTPLVILTYNLKSQAVQLEGLSAIIHASGADVVALQELSVAAAAYLDAEFATIYPYRALHPQPDNPIPGQGILSRYPLTSDEYWRIYLGHQRVTVDVHGQPVTIYNVHPTQPLGPGGFIRRQTEINDILERTAQETGPLLLLGDFNMSDQSDPYREITAWYGDAFRQAGWGLGFTFPAGITRFSNLSDSVPITMTPLVRLDYIFHNAAFLPVEARVWPESGGSDHRPVLATFALVGG